ncbi:hypothetical protein [Actinotalea sp. K2]|uniref:hypothetical protein n=1 Tax=Actinotalea sp. K2 TaxID=2939438 RepID=UPI0020171250|nr:hypothetical protein [Actinotalea sp. K2]MCL3859609.1 hypothetical protein [Actinotalea sp. K2]
MRWSPIVAGGLIATTWVVAIWWRVRRSLDLVLINPDQDRVCPAIMPAPPECNPEWHLSVAATSAAAILLAYGLVVLVTLRARHRTSAVVALAVLVLVGAVGFALVDDWNRYFWSPR